MFGVCSGLRVIIGSVFVRLFKGDCYCEVCLFVGENMICKVYDPCNSLVGEYDGDWVSAFAC